MLSYLIHTLFCRLLRFLGFEQKAWNLQYNAGLWDCTERSPNTIRLATELCNQGKMVEFGCGKGELPVMLPIGAFSQYIGYDISSIAIEQARKSATQAQVSNVSFYQIDMAKWAGGSEIELILVEECLYYLGSEDQQKFLQVCCNSLSSTGRILVVVHDRDKHASTLETCRKACDVIREELVKTRTYLVLCSKHLQSSGSADRGSAC